MVTKKNILCEPGIQSFETDTRNTPDISAAPVLKTKSHLPVVDPSHAEGVSWLLEPLAKAAVAAGTDGISVEVHCQLEEALSDGQQSLLPVDFTRLMCQVNVIHEAIKGDL